MSSSLSAGKAFRQSAHPSFAHLRRLTDDTGLLEHALGRIPRRREGYTTDDNARALWTVTEWLAFGEETIGADNRQRLERLADVYLAFMLWAQEDSGWFLNNFAYDRTLEPEEISHDCQGRSIWACADAWIRLAGLRRETARTIFERTLPTFGAIGSLRGRAFAMASCAHVLQASREGAIDLPLDVKSELQHHLERLESLLIRAYRDFSSPSWRWFEPVMTYSNGVLPWAMLRVYRFTKRAESYRVGMESLGFLVEAMTAEEGWLRPIGNEGWCAHDSSAISRWDQQPLEMFKLALALTEAALAERLAESENSRLVGSARSHGASDSPAERGGGAGRPGGMVRSATGGSSLLGKEPHRSSFALRSLCRDWFYGANDLGVPVADPEDGSCCDGLTPYGPNINCGAEAALSYLMTEALCLRS
ncbi:hypothetical protein [Cohnella hongkongensis]|uniref:Glycosyltransferase n=1 Tax=Cohnella hongkongensis TaxID=178337 RepID=A0ABV9FHL3_9BACL